jgi:hypothetical protein
MPVCSKACMDGAPCHRRFLIRPLRDAVQHLESEWQQASECQPCEMDTSDEHVQQPWTWSPLTVSPSEAQVRAAVTPIVQGVAWMGLNVNATSSRQLQLTHHVTPKGRAHITPALQSAKATTSHDNPFLHASRDRCVATGYAHTRAPTRGEMVIMLDLAAIAATFGASCIIDLCDAPARPPCGASAQTSTEGSSSGSSTIAGSSTAPGALMGLVYGNQADKGGIPSLRWGVGRQPPSRFQPSRARAASGHHKSKHGVTSRIFFCGRDTHTALQHSAPESASISCAVLTL